MSTDPDGSAGPGSRASNERTLGQLVAQATQDIQSIVKGEIALARTEVMQSLDKVKQGAPLLVGAGVVALYALGILLLAIAWGINAAGLPLWLSLLIVAVVLFIVTGVLALVGIRLLKAANPKPERAIAGAEATIEALKNAQATGTVHAAAIPPSRSEVALSERPADPA